MCTLKKKITQKEIAKLAKISPDFLSHIIRGRSKCPPAVAVRLEEVTDISKTVWVWGTSEEIRTAVEQYVYFKANHGLRSQTGEN